MSSDQDTPVLDSPSSPEENTMSNNPTSDTPNNNQNIDNNSNVDDNEVSQEDCINQYPLPPSPPTVIPPPIDETFVGVNLEFTPVVDVFFNKPKIRLSNYANGAVSRKCYRS